MADETSDEPWVKEETEFERFFPHACEEITHNINGNHQGMERERVKKKPGKAVIISGTSSEPPIHDDPIDISNASEYVMEYTDIFGSNAASAVVDSEGSVGESSDAEIVGHSTENMLYTKSEDDANNDDDDDDDDGSGDDDDEDSKEGPPPLESEDDYEYDDSDLGFSPPPIASDGSDLDGYVQSSTHSSPAKSISSTGNLGDQSKKEKEPLVKAKVDRRDSRESDLGYREGPPPLDSEEEHEEQALLENGVDHPDSEEEHEENVEESGNEPVDSDLERDELDSEFEQGGADRDIQRAIQRDINREIQRDVDRDIERDIQRDIDREIQRDVDRDIERDINREIQRDKEHDTERDVRTASEEEPEPEPEIEELQESGPEMELNENNESPIDHEVTENLDAQQHRAESPSENEDLELPDSHEEKGAESPVNSISPEPNAVHEGDGFTDSETSESNEPIVRQETPDIMSDPEAPLLNDKPAPTLVQPKKTKVSLKEKGDSREKSSLLKSESSEDEILEPPSGAYGRQTDLNKSESESESITEEVRASDDIKSVETESTATKYSKENVDLNKRSSNKENVVMKVRKTPGDPMSNKITSTNVSTKKHSSLETKKKAPTKQNNDVKMQRARVSAREKGRESSRPPSVDNSTEDLTKKSSRNNAATMGTERRTKQAPGKPVKYEKTKMPKTHQEGKRLAPGVAVKENTSRRPATGKSKERLPVKDERNKARSPVGTGDKQPRKIRSEAQEKPRKLNVTTKKEERSREDLATQKSETRNKSTRNGEVVKTRQRPKISTKNYVAIGTEDDDVVEETNELLVEEMEAPKTKELEPRGLSHESTKPKQKPRERHSTKPAKSSEQPTTKGHAKHDRSKHVWLCRDDEIHKLIAQKASLLKEYESGSLAGRNVFSGQKSRRKEEDPTLDMPDVSFSGNKSKGRQTRPMSEIIPDREPYTARKRENRRSLQQHYSGSSSEDDDERTNRAAAAKRDKTPSGTFSVGMSSRNFATQKHEEPSDSEHEETCEYCAAEKAAKKAQERDLAWEGPHHPRNLLLGVVYTAKYLGSSQIMSPQSPNRSVRMQQAQEAVGRIKVPEGEDQPTTDVDLFISTERIKVVNSVNKDIMMDHALRTVSFIADIGDVLVLMARRPPGDSENILETKPSASQILASVAKAETDPKMIKITCHVFQAPEAQIIAKSIGQAFNVAYQEFLRTNGISEDSVEDAEYNCVLEAQKILGEDLTLLSDASKSREVVVNKKPAESLGIMIVESGWGSMIPTAIIAHLAKEGPAAKSGRLNVGDQILSVNNTSLVGLPLSECQTIIKNSRPGTKVVMKVVSCPPTVQVVVNRPDTKYQLGFSVQNGMICSLMRGSIAERGGVRVGHRIIEINGQSVVATSHQHIVDLLASTTGEIRMKTMPASMYRLLVGLDVPQYI